MAQLSQSPIFRARPRDAARPTSSVARFVQSLAVQDWVALGYFTLLLLALAGGKGETRESSIVRVLGDLGLLASGLVLSRGGILRDRAAGLVYRGALLASLMASYFQLRDILPAVTARAIDADILAFDLKVFGYEPAVAWDRFVTPVTTEWFSFFYFLYFILLVVHIIPMALFDRDRRRLAWFVLGTVLVFCIGHLGYMVVPGYGPHRFLEGHFEHELEGGTFWKLVIATVQAGGAQKDIFPSLHTAVPTWFAIFSFLNRKSNPFRYTWPFAVFTASQIMLATMFLRWHWVIDVVAGLTLAFSAAFASRWVSRWDDARLARANLPPIFRPLRDRTDPEPLRNGPKPAGFHA